MLTLALALGLSGSGFRYTYTNGNIYDLCFKSDTALTWSAVKGEEAGAVGNEKYSVQEVAKNTYLIGWIEEFTLNGLHHFLTVSQVLNLKNMTINTHLISSDESGTKPEMHLVTGTVTKLGSCL